MLYKAKDFYDITGLKRSTIRHYIEKGLLTPSKMDDNGYGYYSEVDLIETMLIKNYRNNEFEVKDISYLFSMPIASQQVAISKKLDEYEKAIIYYTSKLDTIKNYNRVLLGCYKDLNKPMKRDKLNLNCFYINEAMEKDSDKAKEEIKTCVSEFPFVHIAAKGKINGDKVITFVPGYEYVVDSNHYQPKYPEIYHNLPYKPCILMRICTSHPLEIPIKKIQPILDYASQNKLDVGDDIYSCISALENFDEGNKYYVSIRMYIK